MRTTTVYHNDGSKSVVRKAISGEYEAKNFHQNIIDTYAALERDGKLPKKITARTKGLIRDLHTLAQEPGYWRD